MLEVQKYLAAKSLDELKSELGIKFTIDEEHGLAILNYDQIDSPKTHPIVRECRGLVLQLGTWEIAARSFPRFFNWGEMADEMPLFNFGNFVVDSKEDGSLCVIYFHNGKWHSNTRGSFGNDPMQFQEFTWKDGIRKALGIQGLDELNGFLDPTLTYVCEFVSPWNKVVRKYDEPKLYLLSIFRGNKELSWEETDLIAEHLRYLFLRPTRYHFKSIEQIQEFLLELQKSDPTNEGVVIRDDQNRRWKIKNPTYLGFHRMRGEGDNLFNPKNLIPFVLSGESDELLTYFPEVKEHFLKIESEINKSYQELQSLWDATKSIESQKDFALAIIGKTPFTGILFQIRKTGDDLEKIWRASGEMILKIMYK